MSPKDVELLRWYQEHAADKLVEYFVSEDMSQTITDSSNRYGYFIVADDGMELVTHLL